MTIDPSSAADQADVLLTELAEASLTPVQRHSAAAELLQCASLLATVEPFEAKAQVAATVAMAHLALAQIEPPTARKSDLQRPPVAETPASRVRINTSGRPD